MKNIFFHLFTCTALALFAQTLQAQSLSAADKKGVIDCYNAFMAAFERMDANAISPLLTENAEQIIPNGEIVRGRSNIVAAMNGYFSFLKTQPKPDHMEVKNVSEQYRYLAPDLVLSTYIEETTLRFGDKTSVEKQANAVLLRKTNDKWQAELIALTPVTPMPEPGK